MFTFLSFCISCAHVAKKQQSAFNGASRLSPKVLEEGLFLEAQLFLYHGQPERTIKLLKAEMLKSDFIAKSQVLNLMLAKTYLSVGQPDEAHSIFTHLTYDYPKSEALMSAKASFYYQSGLYSKALALYEKLSKLYPLKSNYKIYHGVIALELGKFAQAWESFNDLAYKSKDAKHLGQYYLGKLMHFTGNVKEADLAYRRCLKEDQSFSDCVLSRAILHRAQGKRKKSNEILSSYTKKNKKADVSIFLQLVDWCLQDQQTLQARAYLEKAIRLSPFNIKLLRKLAMILTYEKDYVSAEERFNLVVKHSGAEEADYINFLNLLLVSGQITKAYQEAERLGFKPNAGSQFFLKKKSIWKMVGKPTTSSFFCTRVKNDRSDCQHVRALSYIEEESLKKASSVYSEIIRNNKKDYRAYYMRGKTRIGLSQVKKGVADIELSLKLNKTFAPALNFISYRYAKSDKKLELAEEYILRALELASDNGHYLDTYGYILYKKGMYTEALQVLFRASEILSEESEIFEHLGDVYLALKDQKAALKFYLLAQEKLKGENQDRLGGKIAAINAIEKPKRGVSSVSDESDVDLK